MVWVPSYHLTEEQKADKHKYNTHANKAVFKGPIGSCAGFD